MDPRLRADEVLARARARGAFVVTPDNATSPMDASTTQRIPLEAVRPGEEPTNQYPIPQYVWPTQDSQSMTQRHPEQEIAFPPEPQDAPDSWHSRPNEFGVSGSQSSFPEN